MISAVKTAYHFFMASNASTLTSRLLLLVLGAWSTPLQITVYAAGERLVSAGINTLTPIMRVMMPKVATLYNESREAAFSWFWRIFAIVASAYGAGTLAGVATASIWIPFVFGAKLSNAAFPISIFLLAVPLSVVSRLMGLLWLVPAELERLYQRITFACCALGLCLAIPAAQAGATAMIILRVSVELSIAIGCGIAVRAFRRKMTVAAG